MIKINELVDQIGVERKAVFISLQHECKDLSEKLIEKIKSMEIPYWCMYDGKGNNTNKGGDDYDDKIATNIHQSCIFVSLVSEKYIKSNEVAKEIRRILTEAGHFTKPQIFFFPIYVDDTSSEDFANFVNECVKDYPHILESENARRLVKGLSAHTIINHKLNIDCSNLDSICEEIKEQYLKAIFENASTKIQLIRNSNVFTDLLNLCIRQNCESNFVNDDIKNSSEIGGGVEVHVLTNEIPYYDIKTYSLVVISSNLLGDEIDEAPYFSPEKRGSKYFYYVTKEFENHFLILVNHLKSFIKKDRESRMKVSGLIRRDFCFKNKISIILSTFENKSVDAICEYLSCNSETYKELEDLFNEDESKSFVSYIDNQLSIPDSVRGWLDGTPCLDISLREEIHSFIEFFKKLLNKLKLDHNISKEFLSEFQRVITNLDALKRMDDWQFNPVKYKLSRQESKQLIRYLLNTNLLKMPNKSYPRIEAWLQFNYDENNNVVEIDDSIVEKALDNCSHIIVNDYSKDNKLVKLAYSFSIFVDEGGITGAWYTTGSRYMGPTIFYDNSSDGKRGNSSTLVTTYNIDSPSAPGYDKLLTAFAYLISVNPEAKKVLEEKGSRLKHYLSGYEEGVK